MGAQIVQPEHESVWIVKDCYGSAHIVGTKLPVWAIVSYLDGMSVDELLKGYSYLTYQGVNAALDYYKHHKEEVEKDRRDSELA